MHQLYGLGGIKAMKKETRIAWIVGFVLMGMIGLGSFNIILADTNGNNTSTDNTSTDNAATENQNDEAIDTESETTEENVHQAWHTLHNLFLPRMISQPHTPIMGKTRMIYCHPVILPKPQAKNEEEASDPETSESSDENADPNS